MAAYEEHRTAHQQPDEAQPDRQPEAPDGINIEKHLDHLDLLFKEERKSLNAAVFLFLARNMPYISSKTQNPQEYFVATC